MVLVDAPLPVDDGEDDRPEARPRSVEQRGARLGVIVGYASADQVIHTASIFRRLLAAPRVVS
jgi:hypothetical protein